MICHHCKTVVLHGEICTQCQKPLVLFQPPPAEFDKKGELYKLSLELRAGLITPENVRDYIQQEQAKVANSRSKIREGEEPLLEEAFQHYENALAQAIQWLDTSIDFFLQSALNAATMADQKVNQSVFEHFEQTKQDLRALQDAVRTKDVQLPKDDDGPLFAPIK